MKASHPGRVWIVLVYVAPAPFRLGLGNRICRLPFEIIRVCVFRRYDWRVRVGCVQKERKEKIIWRVLRSPGRWTLWSCRVSQMWIWHRCTDGVHDHEMSIKTLLESYRLSSAQYAPTCCYNFSSLVPVSCSFIPIARSLPPPPLPSLQHRFTESILTRNRTQEQKRRRIDPEPIQLNNCLVQYS